MSLVVVSVTVSVHSGEGHSVGTFGVDIVGCGGEQLGSSCRSIIAGSSAVELYVLYAVAGNGLVDGDTYLCAELTELEGNGVVAILRLLDRYEVGDVAFAQGSSSTGEGVGLSADSSRSDGRYQHLVGSGCTFIDGFLGTRAPCDEVILSLAVVPVLDLLRGDAIVDGMFDAVNTDILPVGGVGLGGVGGVLNVLDKIVVEDNVTDRSCGRTFVTGNHELFAQEICCLCACSVGTGHTLLYGTKDDRRLCFYYRSHRFIDNDVVTGTAGEDGTNCSNENVIRLFHIHFFN